MCALSHVRACACMCRPDVDARCLPSSLSILFFEAGISLSLELKLFSKICWPVSSRDLLVPRVYMSAGNLNTGPHACTVASYLIGCLPAAFTVKQLETDGRWWPAYLWLSTVGSSAEGRPPLMYVSVLFGLTNGSWRQCIGLCVFFMSHYISGMCICRKTSICLREVFS